MKALRLPARACLVPYGFGCRVHALLHPSCPPRRSRWCGGHQQARDFVPPVSLRSGSPTSWTQAGSLRFPDDPSYTFALLQDPGRADDTSPVAVSPMLPPGRTPRRPQREQISRLTHGFSIRCLRFTTAVASAHARLASGWRAAPLPGGCRTLWIASKGFRLHPSSFPGLLLTQARSCPKCPNCRPVI
jgi:hypothetical protein